MKLLPVRSLVFAIALFGALIGIVGSMTSPAVAIPGPNIMSYPATVRYGDNNHTVGALQGMLREIGFKDTDAAFKFGSSTLAGVKAAQYVCAFKASEIDGIVGPNTWKCIMTINSSALSDQTHGAVSGSAFSLKNHYEVGNNGIEVTVKGTPGCSQIKGKNLSSQTPSDFISWSVPESDLLLAAPGPNVLELRCYYGPNHDVTTGAATYLVFNH